MINKPTIVISAINIFEGGPLTVLKECLDACATSFSEDYKIIALVHDEQLFDMPNIEFIAYPKSRRSYLFRCYYEYFAFKSLSKRLKPHLWLSLHDMTPNVSADIRAVYCHNPSPFYKTGFKDFLYSPTVSLFSLFYKYLYKINILKNDFVLTQQVWLADAFCKDYDIKKELMIVARPFSQSDSPRQCLDEIPIKKDDVIQFFYPAYPRIFKNYEIICEAVLLLNKRGISNVEVFLTIDGTENSYSKMLVDKYRSVNGLNFLGLIDRDRVESYYEQVDALLFPSKLETWGLPISEFASYDKPILAADLPYAYETSCRASKVAFFDPDKPAELAMQMEKLINKEFVFLKRGKVIDSNFKETSSWKELFNSLLSI